MKAALILIDVQNDYFENGKMELFKPVEASLKAKKVLQQFRAEDWPVIHVKHISTREDATFFIPKTNGVEIHENEARLQKKR